MQYDDRREAWDDWVNKINHSLDPLDLEFVHLTDEITGKETYAFVRVLCLMSKTYACMLNFRVTWRIG